MEAKEIKRSLFGKTELVKCSCCGKTIEVPTMYSDKERQALKPYCCTSVILIVQWLIHEGWHVRNLGVTDNHPYFCPDCWEDGTPEYQRSKNCNVWYEQVKKWINDD